jgi:hypothetical protein
MTKIPKMKNDNAKLKLLNALLVCKKSIVQASKALDIPGTDVEFDICASLNIIVDEINYAIERVRGNDEPKKI